jgi:hypothetical protein
VETFVKQCGICQQAKHTNTVPAGLLQPLATPAGAWQDITMDFIEGLPKSEGFSVLLVVVDKFTKFAHFIPLKHPYTAQTVAKAVFEQVVRLHGLPCSIVSDRDRVFTSNFWTELFGIVGTKCWGATRKVRMTTLTQVRVLNTFKFKVRAQRDCDSLCK